MAKTYREFMTNYMRKHKGDKDIKDVMRDGAKAWGTYKNDNGIVIQAKEKSTGPSYSAFVKSYAKDHPGPDLMSRAAKAWKAEKTQPRKSSSVKRKSSTRLPSRKRTRRRTTKKSRKN